MTGGRWISWRTGAAAATLLAVAGAAGWQHFAADGAANLWAAVEPASAPRSPADAAAKPLAKLASVGAWGRLAPRGDVIALAAPSQGDSARVAQIHVREGQRVAADAVVATLDTYARRSAAVERAKAQLAVARAKVEQAKIPAKPAMVAAQEAMAAMAAFNLKQAEMDYRRQTALRRSNAGADDAWEQAKLKLDQNAQTKRHAEATLEALRTPFAADVAVAERGVEEAAAALRQAEEELAAAQVRAPRPGTIFKIHAKPGERVGEKGVLEMGDTEQMYAVAEVYEGDLSRTRVGGKARVRVPTLDAEFPGVVESVGCMVQRKVLFNTDPVADTDARVVEVWIRLDGAASKAVAALSNARIEAVLEPAP